MVNFSYIQNAIAAHTTVKQDTICLLSIVF